MTTPVSEMIRTDLRVIAARIPPRSRVLDLGCGSATLLNHLMRRRGCTVMGVEIDPVSVTKAIGRGVPVAELDIDRDLDDFPDDSFDVVVLSRTLQAVRHPATVLAQMARIAPRVLVTMPNFAYWRNRLLLLGGHAPVSADLPFDWYDSPNVHFGSLDDLEDLLAALDLPIVACVPLSPRGAPSRWPAPIRNWAAGAALYEIGRARTRADRGGVEVKR
ncbi:MAG: methionine biosynthesis protein MetW [Propionibacteriaceae bacterium]|jgi:methionine biosynthesis protein MetW|nr:methionine biosynthesis protein MetW [Propionibacteriaceae bacterium]